MKIELRRPASLVACGGGVVAGLGLSHRGTSAAAASLAGILLAVAALGELPSGLFRGPWRRPAESVVWAAARSLFPLAGIAFAAIGVAAVVPDGGGAEVLAVTVLAILATACVQAFVHAAGVRGSEPASAALLAGVAVAGAAAAGLPSSCLAASWAAAAIAVGRLAWIVGRRERLVAPRGRGRTVWLWPLPAQGRLRPSMTAAAMVAGIASMAVWLVPQPPSVERYAAVAAAIFVALAVPQMTLADGVVDREGWAAVLRPIGRSARTAAGWPPAGRIAFAHAAMFAWPLVVAAALTVRLPGAAVAAASAVAALVMLAAVAAGMTLSIRRLGGSAETAQAVVLAFFSVTCGWWDLGTGGFFGFLPVWAMENRC